MLKSSSAQSQDYSGQTQCNKDQIGLWDFSVTELARLFELFEQERHERVESLAHALEHDDAEWDTGNCVKHAEHLPANRLRRAVAVT
jgi:hypothetical protein